MDLKKLLCLLLALALIIALAACSKEDKNDDGTGAQTGDRTEDEAGDETGGQTGDDTGDKTGDETGDGDSGLPDYTYLSDSFDDNGYFKGVKALECVTLPELDEIAIPEFDKLTDRAVADGDFVNIDYVGSVDGVEFAGGSTQGAGTDVIIGVTSYIDDFLEQIIGHKPGENFDIEVTFPENYGETSLAGKDAVFNITVNYIWDVTDEDAVSIGFTGRDQMAQYVAYYNTPVEDVIGDSGVDVFLAAVEAVNIPKSVTEAVTAQLSAGGGEEPDEEEVNARAVWYLAFQAIAEREGLTATDEDIAERGYEAYAEVYGEPYMKQAILQEKAVDFISEHMK